MGQEPVTLFPLEEYGFACKAVELNGKIDQIIVAAGPPQVPVLVRSPAKDDIFLPIGGERGCRDRQDRRLPWRQCGEFPTHDLNPCFHIPEI